MRKELTPLDALEKIKLGYICGQGAINEFALREDERAMFDIIETALKEYEKPKKIVGSIPFEQSMENYVKNNCPSIAKKLKALEFLKNNLNIEFEIKDNRCFITLNFSRFSARQELPKQEFDLLKEVLK